MINTLFTRAKVLARFQQCILEPHLSDLAGGLHEHGYCDNVIRAYLCAAEKFGRWLSMANLNTSDVNEDLIARYLDEAVRPHPPSAAGRSDSHARTGLAHLLRILREKQVIPPAAVTPPQTAAERWLSAFEQHLVQVAGSALNTRKKYLALARRFVTQQFGDGPVDWALLQADHVAAFVTREAGTKRGFGRKAAPVAIRAVLRFLVYSGDIRAGLEAAVPAMRNWKHAALPRHVSADDLGRVLSLFRDASPRSRRNRAILLSLARLGLRANEIVQLRLEDIDWRGGRLFVRRGKNRIERVLPLSQEVGDALAEYVIKARPRTGSPVIFLNYRPPYRPLAGPSAVSTMAKRALLSIGFAPGPRIGAHTFRHAVASQMVSKGATFKEVADVLGHQSDILLDMVHRIASRAEERVEKRFQSDVRRVSGKPTLLFRLAEAAIAQPEGTIRDVLFPVVSERVWQALVEESRAIGPTYREQLQAVMRNAYRSHYRQMLTRLLASLDFRTRSDRNRPVMDALALIRKYMGNRRPSYPAEEAVPLDEIVPELWRAIVVEDEHDGVPQVNRVAYEICVLGELRERLRTKEIWVAGARRYRDPDEDLPADFKGKRDEYYSALRLPQDAKLFISQVRQELEQELRLLDETLAQNKFVRILDRGRGWISLSPLGKQPEPQTLRHLKSELLVRWPNTSLLDVFKEADLRIGITDVFRSATSFASLDRALLRARLLLRLYGLGTNTGLKRIANGQTDTDYKDLLYVRRRYVTKEQLREAIRLVVNAIFEARDPRIWGEGTTACASDSKKFGAWDQNLMTEWHVRYGGRGVMVYWHVEKKSTCIYSQLKTCSSSEVAAMIEGVLRHCTSMAVEKNYVDSHGQSEVAFAFCRLLGFQLLPRLKAIHAQKLHPSEAGGKARYPHLAPVLSSAIDWDPIEAEYDSFVRYTTGLRLGTANAEDILRRFTRNNAQHPTYQALAELGQACKTIFLCRYLRLPALHREIHEGLQVVENWNSANAFIYFARGGEIASNRVDDQEIAMLSLHLLQICLVYINTLMIQRILADPEWRGRLTPTDLRGLTPLLFTHINPYGTFELDMNTRLPIEPPRYGPGAASGQMWLYDERVG